MTPRSWVMNSSAVPVRRAEVEQQIDDLRLDGDVERRRRLVGDQELRLAGQSDGDHRALAHAAGELVRIFVDAARRQRDADLGQRLDGPLARLLLAHAAMGAQRLGDLLADGEHRIERAHRLLEDHADLPAAHLAHLARADRQQIAALEAHLADDPALRARQQAQDRQAGDGLAAARFAHDAQPLAGLAAAKETSRVAWTSPASVRKKMPSPRTSNSGGVLPLPSPFVSFPSCRTAYTSPLARHRTRLSLRRRQRFGADHAVAREPLDFGSSTGRARRSAPRHCIGRASPPASSP